MIPVRFADVILYLYFWKLCKGPTGLDDRIAFRWYIEKDRDRNIFEERERKNHCYCVKSRCCTVSLFIPQKDDEGIIKSSCCE